jgi:hypothetical protein
VQAITWVAYRRIHKNLVWRIVKMHTGRHCCPCWPLII